MLLKYLQKFKIKVWWAFWAKFFYFGSQFLITLIIAHYSSEEKLGLYSLGLALSTPFFSFFNIELRTVSSTDVEGRYTLGNYISARALTSMVAFFLVIISSILLGYSIEILLIIITVSFFKYLEAISDITQGQYLKYGKLDYYALSMIYKSILFIFSFFIIFLFLPSVSLAMLGGSICYLLAFLTCDLFLIRKIQPGYMLRILGEHFNKKIITQLIKNYYLLGFISLFMSLTINIPRYFIENFQGISKLGVYSVISSLPLLGGYAMNMLGQIVSPNIARAFFQRRQEFYYYQLLLCLTAITISLIGIIITYFYGDIILSLIFGKKFGSYGYELFLFMIASSGFYMDSSCSYTLISLRLLKTQFFTLLCSLIALIASSAFFVPYKGIPGAILSFGLSKWLSVIISLYVIFNQYNIKLRKNLNTNDKIADKLP
jgi:O-antigen/teichoic acid export membrane protein